MDRALKTARKRFTLMTVSVALLCACLSVVGTYVFAEMRMQQKIDAARLGQLTSFNPELSAYLNSQEPYHDHFESIATIIQNEDRRQLAQVLPVVFGFVFLLSGVIGWLLAQRLLKPIDETYAMQKRFMQDAAHELRNPLAAMKSQIQRAQTQKIADARLQKTLASLDRQVTNLSQITTDLLLLERKEVSSKEEANLVDLLYDVTEELQHFANRQGVEIKFTLPDQLHANVNPQHFVYIAKNLIENAIKFSGKSKKPVEVSLEKRQSGWRLVVKDYGIGIPAEDVKYLTQRFYRASNTTEIDGTGLGLTIASKYVSLYKGKLSITSTLGKGTTVTVAV